MFTHIAAGYDSDDPPDGFPNDFTLTDRYAFGEDLVIETYERASGIFNDSLSETVLNTLQSLAENGDRVLGQNEHSDKDSQRDTGYFTFDEVIRRGEELPEGLPWGVYESDGFWHLYIDYEVKV